MQKWENFMESLKLNFVVTKTANSNDKPNSRSQNTAGRLTAKRQLELEVHRLHRSSDVGYPDKAGQLTGNTNHSRWTKHLPCQNRQRLSII